MTFAGVDHEQTRISGRAQDSLGGPQRRSRQRQVVAHRVHITALAAEIDLPVDVDQGGALARDITVEGPDVRVGLDGDAHADSPLMTGSAVASVSRVDAPRSVSAVKASPPTTIATTASDNCGA